jgi:hypothetical protein
MLADVNNAGDEKVPACGNCTRLGYECQYGIRLSFKESRASGLSDVEASLLRTTESSRILPQQYDVWPSSLMVSLNTDWR